MQRFASAGSAAHRAYICSPCLQRLALLERPANPYDLTTRNQRRDVLSSRVLKRASSSFKGAKPSDPASGPHMKESGNGKKLDSTVTESGLETSAHNETGNGEDGVQGGRALAKKSSAKRKLRNEKSSPDKQEAATTTDATPDTKAEEKTGQPEESPKGVTIKKTRKSNRTVGKIRIAESDDRKAGAISRKKGVNLWEYDYIVANHRILKSKLKKLSDARIKIGRSRQIVPDSMAKRYRALMALARRVSRKIELYMDFKNPASTERHDSLKGLSEDTTEMIDELIGMDGKLPLASPKSPLDKAVRDLRCGKALKQLIAARKEHVESQSEINLEERPDTGQLPAIAVLTDEVSKQPRIESMTQEIRDMLFARAQELVPGLEKEDLTKLLVMFSEHLHSGDTREDTEVVKGDTKTPSSQKSRRGTKKAEDEGTIQKTEAETDQPETDIDQLAALITDTRLDSADLSLEPIHVEQAPVRGLSYGLDRVLFNQGVYMLQDPRSKVYNFDPYLQNIMQVEEFNFDLIPDFVTSSKDKTLQNIAHEAKKKYTGSSSSMTGMLSHFHFLLSKFRPINQSQFSRYFQTLDHHSDFTTITKCPAAVFLRWKEEEGLYAVDSDKEHDEMNALSLLGNSLERLLTLPKEKYERFRKGSKEPLSDEEVSAPETYHYTGFEDVLMRSQLDAYDPRLPGSGMFDLKTRAVLPIRMDVAQYKSNRDYEIRLSKGNFESFEREYMDMLRATMIKYMLQYVPLEEIDLALHGQHDRSLGDEEFKLSVSLMNKVFNTATERFPKSSLRIHFHTQGGVTRNKMLTYVEPFTEEAADELQAKNQERNKVITKEILAGIPPDYDDDGKRIVNMDVEAQSNNADVATANVDGETVQGEPSELESSSSDAKAQAGPVEDSTTGEGDEVHNGKPLMVMQLKVQSFVNGVSVVRPGFNGDEEKAKRLEDVSEAFSTSKGDRWAIEYELSEVKPAKVAWELYRQTMAKRSSLISFDRNRNDLEFVRSVLKKYVQRGREYRQRKNEEEGPNPLKVQLGDTRPRSKSNE